MATDSWPLAPCEGSTGIAYDKASNRIFSGCNKTSVVVDPSTGKVVATIQNGTRVDALGWDASKRLIYIPNGGEGNVTVVHLGFESSGLAAHAVHKGLTAVPETHSYFHGEKVAYGVLVQLILEKKPQTLLEEVINFANSVGLPTTLAAIGLADMTDEMLHQIAGRSTAEGETIHNEPFAVEPRMVGEAIYAADALGREWRRKHGISAVN